MFFCSYMWMLVEYAYLYVCISVLDSCMSNESIYIQLHVCGGCARTEPCVWSHVRVGWGRAWWRASDFVTCLSLRHLSRPAGYVSRVSLLVSGFGGGWGALSDVRFQHIIACACLHVHGHVVFMMVAVMVTSSFNPVFFAMLICMVMDGDGYALLVLVFSLIDACGRLHGHGHAQ